MDRAGNHKQRDDEGIEGARQYSAGTGSVFAERCIDNAEKADGQRYIGQRGQTLKPEMLGAGFG